MAVEGNKRPPRIPRTPEEVEESVLLKKIRDHAKLAKFKKTFVFKAFNIFNIICFFIYCELIMCFIGPCHYQTHYSRSVSAEHGREKNDYGDRAVSVVKITGVNGIHYRFLVNDFIEVPEKFSRFNVGKDFLLHKEIKGTLTTSHHVYWIHHANPIFFLSIFVALFSLIFFAYNLNENLFSLSAITMINGVTVLAFMII